jgi:hypothetical protein
MYLPTSTVRYPSSCSQVATVDSPRPNTRNFREPPRGHVFPTISWLWAYWPRKMVALEGQHKGSVTKAFSKVVPSDASSRRLG